MKVVNTNEIKKECLFPCYSPPLKDFLVNDKNILYIDISFNKKTSKFCWYFVKSQRLKNSLNEWSKNK